MDNLFPTNLEDYCSTFQISFFQLKLKCVFCKCYLTLSDLAAFHEKVLSLVWKSQICYACCRKCLYVSAKYEVEQFFQCACEVEKLTLLLGQPLSEISIRCYFCYCLLDLATKHDLIARKKQACLVRGRWRAPCRDCLKRELWL